MSASGAKRRVLITGAAGRIGAGLAERLKDRYDLRLHYNRTIPEQRPVEDYVVANVANYDEVAAAVAGMDAIVHMAGQPSVQASWESVHEANIVGVRNVYEAARQAGVRRFVYVSSSEIYGTAQTVPMTEQHPAWPMTVYGAAKLAGERYTDAYWRTYGFPTVVIRPFNAFGPRSHHEGDCGEVIPKFMLRAMAGRPLVVHGDGTQTRDFTYVADTARGILLAATAEKAVGETINLGQGKEISINQLAEAVGAATGRNDLDIRHGAPRPGDVLRLYSDSRKAAELLGFRPEISLREGLSRLRAWYESSGLSPEALLADEIEMNWQSPARKAG